MNIKGIVDIKFERSNSPRPMPWLGNRFVPVENLFPEWPAARVELEYLYQHMGDWEVRECDHGAVLAGFRIPMVRKIPVIERYPETVKAVVAGLVIDLMRDYGPDMYGLLDGENKIKSTPELLEEIRARIKSRQQDIIEHGGLHWREELGFRLGVSGALFYTHPVMEV